MTLTTRNAGASVSPAVSVDQFFQQAAADPVRGGANRHFTRLQVDMPLLSDLLAWRYVTKNALHSPDVPAVVEFRKAIESAEKEQKSKP